MGCWLLVVGCGLLKPYAQPETGRLPKIRVCPEGVGAWLAGDLLRSSSKPCECDPPDTPGRLVCCRSPADRRQAGLLRPPARIKSGKGITWSTHQPLADCWLLAVNCWLLAAGCGLLKPYAQPETGKLPKIRFCPEGVGAWLAGDLLRSSSKPCERDPPDTPRSPGFAAGPRQIVGKPDSYGLRPESTRGECHNSMR